MKNETKPPERRSETPRRIDAPLLSRTEISYSVPRRLFESSASAVQRRELVLASCGD